MLASLLGWSLVAFGGYVALAKSVRKWQGADGEIEETHESWLPEIREAGKWVVCAASIFGGAWGAAQLSSVARSPGGGSAPAPGAPNTPSITSILVVDSSTVWVEASAFAGSGNDTQDSVIVVITRLGQDTTTVLASSRTATTSNARDTVIDNTNLKADTTYRAWFKYHAVAGGYSAYSAPDTFVNSASAFFANLPSGWTTYDDYGFDGVFSFTSDGSAQSGSIVSASPSISVEDWGKGVALGTAGTGRVAVSDAGQYSPGFAHQQLYPDGLPAGQGASTYEIGLGAARSRLYASMIVKWGTTNAQHMNSEKLFYFYPSSGGYWCGRVDQGWGCEQISDPVGGGDVLESNVVTGHTTDEWDGQWVEVEVCLQSGSGSGVFKMWIDGVLYANHPNLTFSAPEKMQLSGTWGGGGPHSSKTGTSERLIDHWFIAYGASGNC